MKKLMCRVTDICRALYNSLLYYTMMVKAIKTLELHLSHDLVFYLYGGQAFCENYEKWSLENAVFSIVSMKVG